MQAALSDVVLSFREKKSKPSRVRHGELPSTSSDMIVMFR